MAKSSKMHSKHHRNHHHTMSSTYTPQYCTYPQPTARNPTWPEKQADLILCLRDVSKPPAKIPDPDVRNLHPDSQIHVRWTDPDLVRALAQLQESLPRKVNLSLHYGGRDVTAATWVTVHQHDQTWPDGVAELKYVLWFHEYDDLDVEVGELEGIKWGGVKKEEEEVKVKMEDVEAW
ncbi:hypothetical protein HO173_011261 [Letharia columbiana]|uniref:Uncharacterized protein n=1 Tax=Letharia columbiana TaxID=112416 RepID=A0A8H6FJP4_9LECA|nr:uncharacterized protein HO173_011261 [Letharia columbiana]KAF6229745.1 hypothetical protein HO173_011261 [Letharia columbiana]